MESIEIIVNNIIKGIDLNWNKLQKIRYVYLELGNIVEKNTDFFLNDKLGNYGLNEQQMNSIYTDNVLPSRKNIEGKYQYQVICKSAAFLLKTIFDKININSELIYTTATEDIDSDIRHWFIIVQDDEKKQYFLTLAADLPYIKNEFQTEHFATHLTFFSPNGEPNYVIRNDTGMFLRKVEDKNTGKRGYEFDHVVLNEDDLKQIDESIGYGRLYQSNDLISSSNFLSLYYEHMESNSDIYNIFKKSLKINSDEFKSGYSIEEEDIDNFINNLNSYIFNKLGNEKEIILTLSKEIDNPAYNEDDNLHKFMIDNKKKLKRIKNYEVSELVTMLNQVFELEQRFLELKKAKKELTTFYNINKNDDNYDIEKYYELCKIYKNAIVNISIPKLNSILNRIAFYFIKDQISIKNQDNYVSIYYIINKFTVMFPLVFDCNYKDNKVVKTNSFSIQSYSEQVVVIKKILSIIFSELTEKNCSDMEDYNIKYSPIENRIQIFPLKDKKTGEYSIGFRFGKKMEEDAPEYIYIPSENILKLRNPVEDKNKYWICSRRFNNTLQNVEIMEERLISENQIKR